MAVKNAVPNNVKAAIVRIITRAMKPYGLREIKVSAGEDHDGDPVLMVDVYYVESERPIDTKVVGELLSKVQDARFKLGEERFAHLRHHFAEDQKVAGWA